MTQEILLNAHPQGTQFWQFTNDYALARIGQDGKVEPSSRFWLMKHFTDLTPQQSELLASASDASKVWVTAFRKGTSTVLHVLNTGPERLVLIEGVQAAEWQVTQTTEEAQYQNGAPLSMQEGALRMTLPGKSLVTLVSK